MILPSNDYFIGNSTAFDVSSLLGCVGRNSAFVHIFTRLHAGTEAEDFAFGPEAG